MTDDALDRELGRAMAVDPSPDLTARVRMRVASESMTAPWWSYRWRYAAGAVALAAVALFAILGGPRPQRSNMRAATSAQQAYDTAAPTPTLLPSTEVAAVAAPSVASGVSRTKRNDDGRPARAKSSATNDSLEVIVSPDEQRAFWAFVAAERANLVPPMPVPVKTDVDQADSVTLRPIEIAPVTIEPLPQLAQLEGE